MNLLSTITTLNHRECTKCKVQKLALPLFFDSYKGKLRWVCKTCRNRRDTQIRAAKKILTSNNNNTNNVVPTRSSSPQSSANP
jgi:hypothetical protein